MKESLTKTALLISLLLLFPTLSLAGEFKVARVYDGDTVKAEGHDIEIKVRLVGIDAPETSRKKRELRQPYSQQSKKHLAGLVLNKIVDIKGYGLDGYSRILGVIYLDGTNINVEYVVLDPIARAIMSHYYLTEIHPFGDGNGRTARALEALILYQNGINYYCFWSLANFWSANKQEYIFHLGNIRNTLDTKDFVLWGMKGYLEEISRIKDIVLRKVKRLMLMDYVRYLYDNKRRQKIKLNERLLNVLSLLIKVEHTEFSKFLSSPEVLALYSSVSRATRHRDFRKLIDLELIDAFEEDKKLYIKPNFELLEQLTYRV